MPERSLWLPFVLSPLVFRVEFRFCDADRIRSADMARILWTKSLNFSTIPLRRFALGVVARDSEVMLIDGTCEVDRSRRSELAEAEVERRFLNLLNSRFVRTLLGRTEKLGKI